MQHQQRCVLPARCSLLGVSDVCIGSRVTIGCGSAVMPGCVVNDDAVIGVCVGQLAPL